VPPAERVWLLATGTGLGPFLSMLRSPTIWERFSRVVLVHGVRHVSHLGYSEELARIARDRGGQLDYVPALTRDEPPASGLAGRLPALIESGALERRVGLSLDAARDHVLLCGNPAMIEETRVMLERRGLAKHRPRKPGHITIESYW
jgi:ferredoxin/flavodoxin---NADP+ reductase